MGKSLHRFPEPVILVKEESKTIMKTCLEPKTISNEAACDLPFILRFVEPLDQADYDASIADHDLATRTYSPQTQTSIAVRNGSSKTYDSTCSGFWQNVDD